MRVSGFFLPSLTGFCLTARLRSLDGRVMLVQSKSVFNPLDGGVVNVKLAALDQPSVSSSYAKVLINLLASRGIAVSDLLEDAEPFALGSEELGSDDMITGNQLVSLIERGLLLTGDPNLGVWFGLQLKISTHGSVGYAALSSDTLGDAIDLCAKYLKTRFSLFQVSACCLLYTSPSPRD